MTAQRKRLPSITVKKIDIHTKLESWTEGLIRERVGKFDIRNSEVVWSLDAERLTCANMAGQWGE
jgi:hypothetical protein